MRRVVLIPVLITVALGFTAFAVFADRFERQSRMEDIEQELVRAETGAVARLRPAPRGPAGGPDRPTGPIPEAAAEPEQLDSAELLETQGSEQVPVSLVLSDSGQVLVNFGGVNPFSDGELQDLASRSGLLTLRDYRIKLLEQPDDAVVVTALSLEATNDAAADFRRALFVGGALILALVAGALWFLTSWLVRPVRKMADSVSQIASGNLDTSIDAAGSSEMVHLAGDVNVMVATLKQSIDESRAHADEATAARAEMQRFLADLAHELRTPLTALKGYSDLYANGMMDPDGGLDRAMLRIGSESDRLHRLADGMLQIARGDAGQSAPEVVDICVVTAEVVADLRAAFPDHTIDLQMTPQHGQHVLGLPGPLHQAVLNLGSNACEHSPEDRTVVVAVDSTSRSTSVRVIDHGPGIDPQDRERVFSPFYRADVSRSRNGTSGAGLGLALVKTIVESHAGTIGVDETPGGGVTISVVLPRTHFAPGGAGY